MLGYLGKSGRAIARRRWKEALGEARRGNANGVYICIWVVKVREGYWEGYSAGWLGPGCQTYERRLNV